MSQTSLSKFSTVQVVRQSASIGERKVNNILILTYEIPTIAIPTYISYSDPVTAGKDWGTDSQVYKIVNAIFSQSPNILGARGKVYVVQLQANINTPATPTVLTTNTILTNNFAGVVNGSIKIKVNSQAERELDGLDFSGVSDVAGVANVFSQHFKGTTATSGFFQASNLNFGNFASVANGEFNISVDGEEAITVDGLDFTADGVEFISIINRRFNTKGVKAVCAVNQEEGIDIISNSTGANSSILLSAVSGGTGTDLTGTDYLDVANNIYVAGKASAEAIQVTVEAKEDKLVFTSTVSGANSDIVLSSGTTGTDLAGADYLDIANSSKVSGKDGQQGVKESIVNGLLRINEFGIFYGAVLPAFIMEDDEANEASDFIQGSYSLLMYLQNDLSYLQKGKNFDNIRAKGNYQTRCLYYGLENPQVFIGAYSSAYMSINFDSSSSMINLHAKSLVGVAPDTTINDSILEQAVEVGADVYSYTQGVGTVFCSGANEWFDTALAINWFRIANEEAGFNTLRNAKKVPQTQAGIDMLYNAYSQVANQAVRIGFVAPGQWNLPFIFGDPEDFDRNVKEYGYYLYFDSLADQPQSARDRREAPQAYEAIKLAGAVNFTGLLVYINN